MNSKKRRFIARSERRAEFVRNFKASQIEQKPEPKIRTVRFLDRARSFISTVSGRITKEVTVRRNENVRSKRRKNQQPSYPDTSMLPSSGRLRRASGLMTKHRRKHQEAIAGEGVFMHRDLTLAQQIIHY